MNQTKVWIQTMTFEIYNIPLVKKQQNTNWHFHKYGCTVAYGNVKTSYENVSQVTKYTRQWFLVPHSIYIIGVRELESLKV